MLKRYHQIVGGTFRILDGTVVGLAWIAAYWLRFYLPFIEVTKGLPSFQVYAALCPLVIAIWIAVFSYLKIYSNRTILRRTDEVHLVLKAHVISMVLFLALTYLFSEYKYSRAVILYFGITSGSLIVILRIFMRNALREMRKRGRHLRHLICIGDGSAAVTLIEKLRRFPELGLRVAGVIVHEGAQKPGENKNFAGVPVIGTFSEIHSVLARISVDQAVITLARNQYSDLDRILEQLKDETIDIQLVPDIHEYITLGCAIEEFDGLPVVHLNDSPMNGWGFLFKRATDIFLSAAALICLAPVFALISVLIKFTSHGPVFYRQERMGLDGRTFGMLKFRSMYVDAESQTGAVWASKGDDRRTLLGRFLRSTSLDELPQIWNVLKGDMSLVGPRPERPVFVQKFRKDIPHYMLRHKVKAGITGWAQVNGWRGNTSLERRIECDLYYIRNWSYGLDLKIILLTLWKGFINKNAY